MECINHPSVVAAGTCQLCGKALCSDCLNRFTSPLCEPCLLQHNAGIGRKLLVDIGITVVIFAAVLGLLLYRNPTYIQAAFFYGVTAACTYWGWLFLSQRPIPLVFTSFAGLGLFYCVKFVISMFIGIIVTPIQLFRRIWSLYSITALKRKIEQGKA